MTPIIVLTGGGLKGATAAARYARDHELWLTHLNYGQRGVTSEIEALRDLARSFSAAQVLALDLGFVTQLIHRETAPIETTATSTEQESAAIIVARRGLPLTLLSVGVHVAARMGAPTVVTGFSRRCHQTHVGVPASEVQPDFVRELVHVMNIVGDVMDHGRGPTRIEAPLMDLTYAEVVKLAHRFEIPFERTWTCDAQSKHPCGNCDRCRERDRAFSDARLTDTLLRAVTR